MLSAVYPKALKSSPGNPSQTVDGRFRQEGRSELDRTRISFPVPGDRFTESRNSLSGLL